MSQPTNTQQIIDNRILRDAIKTGGQLSAWTYAGNTTPAITRSIARLQEGGLLTTDLWITSAGRARVA